MAVALSQHDRALLEGEHGPASAMSMRILTRMAEIQRARGFLSITGAHIDSALFMGDATLEYAERLADLGAAVVVPTTLNVAGVDPHGWERWAVPPEWAAKASRQMDAYRRMGCGNGFDRSKPMIQHPLNRFRQLAQFLLMLPIAFL